MTVDLARGATAGTGSESPQFVDPQHPATAKRRSDTNDTIEETEMGTGSCVDFRLEAVFNRVARLEDIIQMMPRDLDLRLKSLEVQTRLESLSTSGPQSKQIFSLVESANQRIEHEMTERQIDVASLKTMLESMDQRLETLRDDLRLEGDRRRVENEKLRVSLSTLDAVVHAKASVAEANGTHANLTGNQRTPGSSDAPDNDISQWVRQAVSSMELRLKQVIDAGMEAVDAFYQQKFATMEKSIRDDLSAMIETALQEDLSAIKEVDLQNQDPYRSTTKGGFACDNVHQSTADELEQRLFESIGCWQSQMEIENKQHAEETALRNTAVERRSDTQAHIPVSIQSETTGSIPGSMSIQAHPTAFESAVVPTGRVDVLLHPPPTSPEINSPTSPEINSHTSPSVSAVLPTDRLDVLLKTAELVREREAARPTEWLQPGASPSLGGRSLEQVTLAVGDQVGWNEEQVIQALDVLRVENERLREAKREMSGQLAALGGTPTPMKNVTPVPRVNLETAKTQNANSSSDAPEASPQPMSKTGVQFQPGYMRGSNAQIAARKVGEAPRSVSPPQATRHPPESSPLQQRPSQPLQQQQPQTQPQWPNAASVQVLSPGGVGRTQSARYVSPPRSVLEVAAQPVHARTRSPISAQRHIEPVTRRSSGPLHGRVLGGTNSGHGRALAPQSPLNGFRG